MKNTIYGFLGSISTNQVIGWVKNTANVDHDLVVQLVYCGKTLMKTKANVFRSDLIAHGKKGHLGFVFNLNHELIPHFVEVIVLEYNVILNRSNELTKQLKCQNSNNSLETYFYMHIPKTGGTSFHNSIVRHFGDDNVFPSKKLIVSNEGHYPPSSIFLKDELTDEYIRSKKFIYGHFPFEVLRKYGDSIISLNPKKTLKILTVVRNPLDRLLSTILHFKNLEPSFHNLSLYEIGSLLPLNQIDNVLCRYFTDEYENKCKLNSGALLKAKQNITQFFHIGVTESFQESQDEFCSKTGIPLGDSVHLNGRKVTFQEEDLKEFIEFSKPFVEFDNQLYSEILTKKKSHEI